MKIAWLTDIHLNFLKVEARKKFYRQIVETSADRILINVDIAEAKDVCEILHEFSTYTNKPIYFVLGNHDYYFGSVNSVREKVRALCAQNKNLIWLEEFACRSKKLTFKYNTLIFQLNSRQPPHHNALISAKANTQR